jgi:hypothetical protein
VTKTIITKFSAENIRVMRKCDIFYRAGQTDIVNILKKQGG